MARLEAKVIDFFQNTGGIDTVSASTQLGTSKLRDAQNIDLFPVNGYTWRNGYSVLNATSPSVAATGGLYMARYSAGTNVALRVCGEKLESMDSLDGTWDDRTNGLTITAGDNIITNFAMLNDIVVGCNDTDTTFQVNSGLTAAVLAGTPAFTSALFPVEYRGYMFYGNTVESATRQPDRLRFSDVNAPNAFTMLGSNNYIDVAKKQGGDVRGAVEYKSSLYVFKRHGIYQVNYQPTRVNSSGTLFPFLENPNPVVSGVGTQSHRSIVKFTTPISNAQESGAELVFFVDQFGMPRIFDGVRTVQIGYPISYSRDSAIKSLSVMSKTRLPYVWAMNYPDKNRIYVWYTQTGSQHDTCWCLDYTNGFAWTRHSFADKFNSGTLFEKSNGVFKPYWANYDGIVFEGDTGTSDNTTAIVSYAIHGDCYLSSPVVNSNWPWIEVRGNTGTSAQDIKIDFYKDGSDTSSKQLSMTLAEAGTVWGGFNWGQDNWFGGSGVITQQKEVGMDAKTVRVKLSNSILDYRAVIEGFSIAAIPEGSSQI